LKINVVYTDGSGNGYYGYQIGEEEPVIYHAPGKITNNQAEFEALVCLLRDVENDSELLIFSDSMLLVNGFNQSWSLRNVKLKQLRDEALRLVDEKHLRVKVGWVPRKKNVFGNYLDKYKGYQ